MQSSRAKRSRTPLGSACGCLMVAALILQGCASFGAERAMPGAADASSLRSTSEGVVLGVRGELESHAWLGIPYAAPPVGEARWRAPSPPARRPARLDALQPGPVCPQISFPGTGAPGPTGSVVGSEDCLYLNIFAPRWRPEDVPSGQQRLPVLVWVHGGANVAGTGSAVPGDRLASRQAVVVVTLNYRLGPLGWLRHPALRETARGPADASGNYGTLDLIRALEWVRDNVANFGGDPDRVSVFGESAGGVNILSLLASPLARGLFAGAIVQSGRPKGTSLTRAENLTDQDPPGHPLSGREIGLRALIASGRARDRGEAQRVAGFLELAELASVLRAATPEALIANDRANPAELLDLPTAFPDGHVLPEADLSDYLTSPAGTPRIPVMLGTNRDETRAFQLGEESQVRWLLGLFPRARDPLRYVRRASYASRMWKAVGADELAIAWADAGNEHIYAYRFDWDAAPSGWWADLETLVGASHALDVPFVFGRFDALGDLGKLLFTEANAAGRRELSRAMMSYWAAFAARGAPGRGRLGELPRWLSWSNDSKSRFLVLDTRASSGLRMSHAVVTRAQLARELLEDPILESRKERCEWFAHVGQFGDWEPEQTQLLGCPKRGAGSE